MAAVIDTHAAVRKLESAGMASQPAEAIAEIINESVANLVTKAEFRAGLDQLRTEIRADIYHALWLQGGAIIVMTVGLLSMARFL